MYDTETKEAFYDNLSDEIRQTSGNSYVGGDFNARIHHVRDVDADVCGPFISGRGPEFLNGVNESTRESRALFLGFAKLHSLKVLSSFFFEKPNEKLITYKYNLIVKF